MNQKKNLEFPGFDEFVVRDDEKLIVDWPMRIKLIDTQSFVEVHPTLMKILTAHSIRSINLEARSKGLSKATSQLYCYSILHALNGRRKGSTVVRWLDAFSRFISYIYSHVQAPISTITLAMFNHYCTRIGASEHKLLRSVLKYWSDLSLPGIAQDLSTYIALSSPPKPRSTIAIQNADEKERPFSISQIQAVLLRVNKLFESKIFDPQSYLLWRLLISEALRPTQLDLLLVGDVKIMYDGEGRINHAVLDVPIIKQAGTPGRHIMISHKVSNAVAQALKDHLDYLAKLLGGYPSPSLRLFSVVSHYGIHKVVQQGRNVTSLIEKSRKHIAELDGVVEESDLFSRRFKHTKLTHLAILGASVEVLARAAFHTSKGSLKHYVNLSEEAYIEYENMLLPSHESILNAFQGKIVEPKLATNPSRSHAILDIDMENDVGSCAANLCNVFTPVGCYVCPRFEAYKDGPHKKVLQYLERKKIHRLSLQLGSDSISRDDQLINAVQNVINAIHDK